ncbi:hypothetical protein [Gracilibacillus xinjiangensis]|uniref:GerMN domain-containing protein n=1 Tax=Gracilibacillus xinjiangensis TaxID=1193282 RepID=A0ABV8WXW8_9BACI
MTTNHPNHSGKVETLLKQMPKIEDTQSKEVIYRKIQTEINKTTSKQKSKIVWLIPTLATIGCLIILLIAWNGLENFSFYTGTDTSQESTTESNESDDKIGQEAEIMEDASIEQKTTEEGSVENNTDFLPPVGDRTFFQHIDENSFIYRTDYLNDQNILYTSWATEEAQYVVPISLMNTSIPYYDLAAFYENATDYLSLADNGFHNLAFDQLDFNIDQAAQRVEIQVNENYPVMSSGANFQMFRKMLSDMFVPLGIKQVVLTGNHSFVEEQNNFSPEYRTNTLYKIYQYEDDSPFWLIPTAEFTFQSFGEAIEEMKNDEEPFRVSAPIPKNASIEVNAQGDMVNVTVTSTLLGNNQGTLTMIEAILLAAKSFGYNQVKFDIEVDNVGKYDLTKPLDVPDIINPVY